MLQLEELKQKFKEFNFREAFENSKNSGLLDKIFWGLVFIVCILGLVGFILSKIDNKNTENLISSERIVGDYTIFDMSGPKPFTVSLKEEATGKIFENIKISEDCPKFHEKSYIGEKMELVRFKLVDIEYPSTEKFYFRGVEERVCEGRTFVIDSTTNFYVPN